MINKVILLGRVGKDPEIRRFENGSVIGNFTLATSERNKDRQTGEMVEKTEWHSISCYGKTAEFAEKYIKKGTTLYVEGKIKYKEYTGKDGVTKKYTEILADTMQFVGKREDNKSQTQQGTPVDDLPFNL